MGCVDDEAGDYLVARGYLVLEAYAKVGDGARKVGVGPLYAFAVGPLVGEQFGVAEPVPCSPLPTRRFLLARQRFSTRSTPRMMPPGGVRHIDRSLLFTLVRGRVFLGTSP